MSEYGVWSKIDKSALITVIGILLLFASAVGVTLVAPGLIDPSWTEPSLLLLKGIGKNIPKVQRYAFL